MRSGLSLGQLYRLPISQLFALKEALADEETLRVGEMATAIAVALDEKANKRFQDMIRDRERPVVSKRDPIRPKRQMPIARPIFAAPKDAPPLIKHRLKSTVAAKGLPEYEPLPPLPDTHSDSMRKLRRTFYEEREKKGVRSCET